ncbi:MAG: response regulator [Archangium sp.]|nr:response regulator [Archangium sp.]
MSDTPDTVLLVDDEKSILDVLSMGFKKAGIPVKTAINAEDAILQLESYKFGAVVTDKNLPGKSGLDLLKVVNERYAHCARVVITGFVNTESVLEAMRLGADDYLLKPFESIMLVVERVKQAMKHRKVQMERESLAKALREMEKSLRKSESTAFQKGTELDLFQNVVELRIEDATRELTARVGLLEAELEVEKERRAVLKRTLAELSGKTEGELAKRLLAEAEILG